LDTQFRRVSFDPLSGLGGRSRHMPDRVEILDDAGAVVAERG